MQVLTRGPCVALCRGQEEKSHCPGAEQLMPSGFAHHLISTSRSLPAAGLCGEKGWTQPCHHGAIFIHEQKISELEKNFSWQKVSHPFDFRKHSSSPDSGATSSSDAPFILPNCCMLLKMQKKITKDTKIPLYSFIVGFGFVLFLVFVW